MDRIAYEERLETAGQGHLVEHARSLRAVQGEAFLSACAEQPWEEILEALRAPSYGVTPSLRPPHALTRRRQESEGGIRRSLAAKGRGLLAGGRVAAMLLAGGQGTRLGLSGPKGGFVLGPEDDRTLYAIQVERVVAEGRAVGRAIPLIVLVSEATEQATREAFEAQGRAWGLEDGQVRFVKQRQLPAVDDDSKAILAAPGRLAMAPDGHGGALGALVRDGVLDELAAAEVDVLTTFQVDNPLALPLDPVMLGWMVERHAEAIGKAVRRLPDEKVGVFARDLQGRHLVVEYSEFPDGGMPDDLTMGSIALNGFSVPWLKRLFDEGLRMPYHRAFKKVAFLGPDGTTVDPEAPNAWKLEQFIFDVFPLAKRAEVHEVVRAREFAPVKNAEGTDSPATARSLVAAEVRRLCEESGTPLPDPVSLRPLG